MARYIVCKSCDDRYKVLAKQCGELYESIEGSLVDDKICDACGVGLNQGDTAFAGVLLDKIENPRYRYQKPSAWMLEYFNI